MLQKEILENIIDLLRKEGPLTGKKILDKSGLDILMLWRLCNNSMEITLKTVGRKYLRLDKRVKGYARLSPSIMREFLTYTIAGSKDDIAQVEKSAQALAVDILRISRDKTELAREVIAKLVDSRSDRDAIIEKSVFIIAGDVVYDMAHSELRPESSTGEMVRGSDMDIIIITDSLEKNAIASLDRSIYEEKYHLLKNPAYREEIDYIIKDLKKVEEQLSFDTFEHMVASKIMNEGVYTYGSYPLFEKVKKLLLKNDVPKKLKELEEAAIIEREAAWSSLLVEDMITGSNDYKNLFYTKEETEEIF